MKWIDEVLGIKPKPAEKDLLAQWDEMAGVSGRGRRLGQRLLKKDLEKIKAFPGKMGFALELHPAEGEYVVEGFFNLAREPITLAEGAQAMFVCTAEKGKVVLREGCTINEFFHELMHAKHAKNLGLKKYIGLGGRGTVGQLYDMRVTNAMLTEGGYMDIDADGRWWVPSGTAQYGSTPAARFYTPVSFTPPGPVRPPSATGAAPTCCYRAPPTRWAIPAPCWPTTGASRSS